MKKVLVSRNIWDYTGTYKNMRRPFMSKAKDGLMRAVTYFIYLIIFLIVSGIGISAYLAYIHDSV